MGKGHDNWCISCKVVQFSINQGVSTKRFYLLKFIQLKVLKKTFSLLLPVFNPFSITFKKCDSEPLPTFHSTFSFNIHPLTLITPIMLQFINVQLYFLSQILELHFFHLLSTPSSPPDSKSFQIPSSEISHIYIFFFCI